MLECPDDELLDLLAAAYRVRRRWFGNQVQLYFLMNAKSGLCPEDCGYCSQSKVSEAEIPRYNLLEPRQAARRRPRRRRAAGPHVLHRDLRPRPERARDGRRHHDRAGDQAAVQPEDLRLPGPAHARPGPAAEGLRRRSRESQSQHQRELLRRDLHDAHLPRPRRHAARRPRRRHGDVLRRHHRHGRAARGRRRDGDRAARPGRAIDPGQLSEPDRRHAARPAAAISTRAIA